MRVEQYFPQGIATGGAFLDRQQETGQLIDNIKKGRHSLLVSPRRYGKTSLVRHAINSIKYDFSEIDLFLAIDGKAIESRFLAGIEALIQNFSEEPEQWLITLIKFFKKAKKKWTVGFKGLQLEMQPWTHDNIAANLLDAFNALEHVLSKKKQRAVIFVDEFQEIGKLDEGGSIEGSIRHFAQSSKYLVFIFSGSNRRMLEDIFGNRTRPLYSLCQWIALHRLSADIYLTYLKKISKRTFSTAPSNAALLLIIELTECHPEAMYGFCAFLWQYCTLEKRVISENTVNLSWQNYVVGLIKQTKLALSEISAGQLKLLILIALGHDHTLTGKKAQSKLNLTSPSIAVALKVLSSRDFIEKLSGGAYRIINPVVKTTLANYYADYL